MTMMMRSRLPSARRLAQVSARPQVSARAPDASLAIALTIGLTLASFVAGCARASTTPAPTPPVADLHDAQLADLEQQESALRAATDWATFPSSDVTLGPDPVDVIALPLGGFAGVLRGADALVFLDHAGNETRRMKAPRGARALSRSDDGLIAVVGELDPRMMTLLIHKEGEAGGFLTVPRVRGGMRSVAHGPREKLYVTDTDGALHVFSPRSGAMSTFDVGPPPVDLVRAGPWLVAMSAIGHRITAIPVDARSGELSFDGARVLENDGPFWGFDARVVGAELWIAAGHVEDHALDRTGGSFGYVDSFVRVVKILPRVGARGEVVLERNVGELGVVVPKAVRFVDDVTLIVVGAGGQAGARIHLARADDIDLDSSVIDEVKVFPGVTKIALLPEAGGFIGASALLDAWVVVDAAGVRATPVPATVSAAGAALPERSVDSKLGEALAFTTIMAPRQKTDGALSRFTCETCHFEGGVDGRVHHTGRGDVTATTKPLFGLFNNKPLFTRALDENLTQMAHAEFGVANANSGLDPWFALTPADAPWLSLLGVKETRAPIDLRRALTAFLHDFTPRANARAVDRTARGRFTDEERAGAALFRARCASCHAARLIGDDARTEQPFERWEALVLSENGPLVWSTEARKKTGIEPYVHEEGARPSSLRRIDRKRPFFTNGSSPTLGSVLERARFNDSSFMHTSNQDGLRSFDDAERRALLAFLRLL